MFRVSARLGRPARGPRG